MIENLTTKVQEFADFANNYSGYSFANDVAKKMADELHVDYVLVGVLTNPQQDQVKTVSLYSNGNFLPEMVYKLEGTPCENVIGRNICYYPLHIQELFPEDKELKDLNIESYVGAPLFDESRRPIGIIVLMHSKVIEDIQSVEAILKVITPTLEECIDLKESSSGGW